MKRWAKNLACLFSLLVFLSSVTLWVRSYFTKDSLAREVWQLDSAGQSVRTRRWTYSVFWSKGTLGVVRNRIDLEGEWPGQTAWYHLRNAPSDIATIVRDADERINIRCGGAQFYYLVGTQAEGWRSSQRVVLPLWLFLPAGVPPLLWWRRWKRNRGRGIAVLTAPRSPPAPAAKI